MTNTNAKQTRKRFKQNLDRSWVGFTPGALTDAAYSLFVYEQALANVNGESSNGEFSPTAKRAKRSVDDFCTLLDRTKPGTPEWDLACAYNRIIVSLARGIQRRKQTFHESKEQAKDAKEEHKRIVASANKQAVLFTLSMKALLLGIIGALASKFFLPMIKGGDLSNQSMMSVATGLGVALASDYFKRWIIQVRFQAIDAEYNSQINFAQRLYRKSTEEEYARAELEASLAWQTYTGCPPPDTLNWGDLTKLEGLMFEDEDTTKGLLSVDRVIHWLLRLRRPTTKTKAPLLDT